MLVRTHIQRLSCFYDVWIMEGPHFVWKDKLHSDGIDMLYTKVKENLK